MKKQILGAAGILAVGLAAGSALSINVANAADTTTTTSSSSSTTTPAPNASDAPNLFSVDPIRSDEKAVSTDVAAKLTAAAEAQVSGATVIRVETDGDGAAYEVHMKKADGSVVTVKFDSSYNVTGTETGFGGHNGGKGDNDGDGPQGAGHPGDNDGDGPSSFQVPSTGSTSGTTGTNG